MNDIFNRLLSLDIETTGLDVENDKIWSIGLAGNTRLEKFINPTGSTSATDVINEIGNMNPFSKQQMINKSFEPLRMAISAGEAIGVQDAMSEVFGNIKNDSIVLIQNSNFENRFISEQIKNRTDLDELQKKMMYSPRSNTESGKLFYTPPKVIQHGLEASSAYDEFLRSGSEELFQESRKAFGSMIGEYERLFNKKGQGAITVDLMDITRSTYAEAANKGFLSKQNVNIGTNIEFLARAMFGEKEAHTALSDADQQIRIFKELYKIRGDLESGNISNETRDLLSKIKSGQKYEKSRQFISSLKNTLEEIEYSGETRIIPHQGLYKGVRPVKVSTLGPDGVEEFFRPRYRGSLSIKSPDVALQHVLKRFEGQFTPGISSKEGVVEALKGKGTIREKIDHISLLESEFKGEGGKIAAAIGAHDKPFRKENIKDSALAALDVTKDKIRNITPTQKKLGLAGLGLFALGAGISMSQGEEDFKKKKETEDKSISIQNTLKMYDAPVVYHGSGFADWNERTGHHRY